MSADSTQRLLEAGIAAARRGDKAEARRYLEAVIDRDSNNELAWIWLASSVETLRERRICLEKVLQINPRNERAREALIRLVGVSADNNREINPDALQQNAASQSLKLSDIAIIAFAGIATVVVVVAAFTLFTPAATIITPTPIPQDVVMQLTATRIARATIDAATPTRFMSPTFPGVEVTRSTQTQLPPTFTPTATDTPTNTPTATPTPFPLSDFMLLFTMLDQADINPSLFESNGAGESIRQLADNVRDPEYTLAGDRIAFVRDVEYTTDEGPVTGGELFIAPIDNLEAAQQLTEFRAGSVSSPTFSRDGSQIAFATNADGDDELWLIGWQTNELIKLTDNTFIDRDPHWSLMDDRLVFVSDRRSPGRTRLFTYEFVQENLNNGGPTNTDSGFTVRQVSDAPGSSYQPRWSPDSRRIVFVNDRDGDGDIYIVNADGQNPRVLTLDGETLGGVSEDLAPDWTPDGRLVAFISNRQDDRFQIYTVDPDSRDITRLMQTDSDILSLTYQPNILYRIRLLNQQ